MITDIGIHKVASIKVEPIENFVREYSGTRFSFRRLVIMTDDGGRVVLNLYAEQEDNLHPIMPLSDEAATILCGPPVAEAA